MDNIKLKLNVDSILLIAQLCALYVILSLILMLCSFILKYLWIKMQVVINIKLKEIIKVLLKEIIKDQEQSIININCKSVALLPRINTHKRKKRFI